jgi:hypothetical protein
MARKPSLSQETLTALGAEKLARLLLEEAEASPALRKRLNAALAGGDGPEAVAKLIDRRLAGLERARAMVAWEKERALAQDLGALVASITGELAPLCPWSAAQRLLRFLDTHVTVFERIDDSSGRIQDVYWQACQAMPALAARLSTADRERLPALVTASVARDTHGLAYDVAKAVVPLLQDAALAAWDAALAELDGGAVDVIGIRQAIADARGDLDGYLALEAKRPDWGRKPLAAAERLLTAGRLDEALTWARTEHRSGLAYASAADIADGRGKRGHDLDQVRMEARILEAMADRPAAQSLRWSAFEATLDASILREYIAKLGDFEEFDAMDRAFAVALASPHAYAALMFLIDWLCLDKAATLVLERMETWDGRHYDVLASAATALEGEHPLAATILIRALLNDILGRAKSQAYGHGARYLATLTALAGRMPDDSRIDNHATYLLRLRKDHGRKTGFWSRVIG